MTKILEPADWSFPIPIKYGPGRIGELGSLCAEAGLNKPLIVTDRGSRDLPFIASALAALAEAGLEGVVFSDVASNPTDQNIIAGREAIMQGARVI